MSPSAAPKSDPEPSEKPRPASVSPATVIALFGDEYAREFVAAIRDEPKPARAIAEECDASRATVYRRLDRLVEAGLVAERPSRDGTGHDRRRFVAAVERIGIALEDDGFEAEVTRSEPAPAVRK